MKILFFSGLLAISSFAAAGQGVTYMAMKQETIAAVATHFYVADVIDDRADKDVIGSIKNGNGKTDRLAVKNGLAATVKKLIAGNAAPGASRQPVALHLKQVHADIRRSGSAWQIEMVFEVAFYVAGKRVMQYTGKAQGKVMDDPAGYVDKYMRQTIKTDLQKFDTWWQQHKGGVVTSQAIKVNVTVSKTTDKPDCIAYSLERPLQIADFKGPVQGEERELAVTLSGIAVNYSLEVKNSRMVLSIMVTPYFNKSLSWMKERGKTAWVLAHEQTHFDIAAIKACEFAAMLEHAAYTEENFSEIITDLHNKITDQVNAEENKYDEETNHGIIEDKQLMWQKRMTEQVKNIGCF